MNIGGSAGAIFTNAFSYFSTNRGLLRSLFRQFRFPHFYKQRAPAEPFLQTRFSYFLQTEGSSGAIARPGRAFLFVAMCYELWIFKSGGVPLMKIGGSCGAIFTNAFFLLSTNRRLLRSHSEARQGLSVCSNMM